MSRPAKERPELDANLDVLRQRIVDLERQLAAERTNSNLFQTLLDTIPDTIYIKDCHSRFVRVNRAEARVLGIGNPEDAIGKSDADFHEPEFAAETLADEQRAMRSGVPIENKIERLALRDGGCAWFSTTKAPFYDTSGNVQGVLGIGRDITDRIAAEDALRASEDRYRQLFNEMFNAFALHELLLDSDGNPCDFRYLEANPAFEKFIGLPAASILGKRASEISPALVKALLTPCAAVAVSGVPAHFEQPLGTPNRLYEVVAFSPGKGLFATIFTDRTAQFQTYRSLEASSQFIQRIADITPGALYIFNLAESRLTYANQRMLSLLNTTAEQVANADVLRAMARVTHNGRPVDVSYRERYARLSESETLNSTYEFTMPDGQVRYFEAREVIFSQDSKGQTIEVLGAALDVTEKIVVQRKLAESEQRLRTITDNILDLIVYCDANLLSTYLSPSYTQVLGYDVDELLGTDLFWLIHPDDVNRVIDTTKRCIQERVPGDVEFRSYRKDGNVVWFHSSGIPLFDENGDFSGAIIVSRDITAKKQAEAALRKSDQRYRDVVERSRGIIACLDMGGRFIMINPGGAQSLGYTPDEMIGRSMLEFLHNPSESVVHAYFDALAKDRVVSGVCRLITKAGSDCYWEYQDFYYEDDSGTPCIMAHALDITASYHAQEALKQSEERYRLIFQGTRDAISFIGRDGRRIVVNKRFAEMTGYTIDELLAEPALSMCHPGDVDRVRENFRRRLAGEPADRTYEYRLVHKDGHVINIEGAFDIIHQNDEVIGVCAILRDITERKRAEEERINLERQLLHVQKLESLGLLAGGIAHDFNNILVAILGNAELAMIDLPNESPAIRPIEEIRRAGIRASDLCRQMLAYSGKGRFIVETISINDLVREMTHLLRVSVTKLAELHFDFDDKYPMIEGDATQIRQVVMNLITNASEALDSTGGVITIRTGTRTLDRGTIAAFRSHDQIPAGLYTYFEVTDTGAGMTPDVLDRVFDPFFTTKFTGRGLGMAAVLGIVRGHKGAIHVESTPGLGSTFVVYLPASEKAPPEHCETPASPLLAWRGHGTVLIIDDEESMRNVGSIALKRCGLNVLTADDGMEGIDVFSEHASQVDLVLLDLTMPRLSGEDTLRSLRAIRPDIPVVLVSGYTDDDTMRSLTRLGISGFIQKPFQIEHLLSTVRRIIDPESVPRSPGNHPNMDR